MINPERLARLGYLPEQAELVAAWADFPVLIAGVGGTKITKLARILADCGCRVAEDDYSSGADWLLMHGSLPSVITRLLKSGGKTPRLVVSHRKIQELCPDCKKDNDISARPEHDRADMELLFGMFPDEAWEKAKMPKGCGKCQRGFVDSWHVAVSAMPVDCGIGRDFEEKWLAAHPGEGLFKRVRGLVADGLVDPANAARTCGLMAIRKKA